MNNRILSNFEIVESLVDEIGDQKLTELSKFLGNRIKSPDSFIVLFGETSSGKTTLLNGLLGEHLLYTSVSPSTGAIVEICFDDKINVLEYYAINNDASIERLDKEIFDELNKNPDEMLNRLKINAPKKFAVDGALRLFDTPGYGSLIDQHEKVLMNILPESNLLVYVVSYKVGIQQDDINFLKMAAEVITEGTKIVLVINRVPEEAVNGDIRSSEIEEYVSDFLHYKPKTILISNELCENDEYPLPKCNELWNYVGHTINAEESQIELEICFTKYIFGLVEHCEHVIIKKEIQVQSSEIEKKEIKGIVDELRRTQVEIQEELIKPTFKKLIEAMPVKLDNASLLVGKAINSKIDDSSKLNQDEMLTYINQYMLSNETSKEMQIIKSYIELTLRDLDKKIGEKLNIALCRIEKTIELNFNDAFVKLSKNLIKKSGGRILEASVLNYFKQFAGRGGTGIANGAKHLLKKAGDMFGKTFSRETHNNLAKFLSKVGATSAKAVGIGVSVIIETLFIITDLLTWQKKLKKATKKGINVWKNEVVTILTEDLEKLKDENIQLVNDEIEMWVSNFTFDESAEDITIVSVEKLKQKLEEVKVDIEYKGEDDE
ncbi:conserved protein of unknown function [Petrocella atlantisensis]|uniref:Dynamin N-terminal domain-containing protein n=1 Tax=Petrocella atlantisensis TaxID=2173034 RepID=A0A3P7RX62_9FIRM|nr:dynamin family protein [Petrocella atlantisensis]VDN47242.1 conserved protein of unknown function [Petrocella atlantisensis]